MEVGGRAWLALAVGDDRQHGGNDGYDDQPDAHYSWDDTVPNHAAISVGDHIVLWDKRSVIGASTVEKISLGTAEKIRRQCPRCRRADFKSRKTLKPRYWCYNCREPFDVPLTRVQSVTTYRSRHDAGWVHLDGCLDGASLRRLCIAEKSQLSIRALDWRRFLETLRSLGRSLEVQRLEARANLSHGGHRMRTVRVRLGQTAFRERLLSAYGSTCAFTGPAPAAVLEAGHLYSYANIGQHHEHGGLLLRRDIHRLFDDGLLAVDPHSTRIDLLPQIATYDMYSILSGRELQCELTPRQHGWLADHWRLHRVG